MNGWIIVKQNVQISIFQLVTLFCNDVVYLKLVYSTPILTQIPQIRFDKNQFQLEQMVDTNTVSELHFPEPVDSCAKILENPNLWQTIKSHEMGPSLRRSKIQKYSETVRESSLATNWHIYSRNE